MYDGFVWDKSQSLLECLLLRVGTMSMVQKSCAGMPKVANLILAPQHLAQASWVGCNFGITMSIAVGDTVTYAGNADGRLRKKTAHTYKAEQYECE
jgi:hypothetical protein